MTPPSTDSKYVKGVVTARREISHDLWIARLRPETKVTFQSGQYATLGVVVGEKIVERPYSIASSPFEDELEFFFELVHHGKLTPHLHSVPEGGEVFIRRSTKGAFLFDAKSGHPNHFMVGTVTGAAPYISMVRGFAHQMKQGGFEMPLKRLFMIHAASVSDELGYTEELVAFAKEHPWFTFVPTISRPWLNPEWKGELGRAEDIARKYLDGAGFTAADTTAYMCGNPQMTENMKALLKRAGFPKESLKEELYWPAEKGAAG